VGSVVGRYFGMDRDERCERTQKARDLLVEGIAEHHAETGEQAVRDAYAREETDEFIARDDRRRRCGIRRGDSRLTFNFRPDRMRQIVDSLSRTSTGSRPSRSTRRAGPSPSPSRPRGRRRPSRT
jgi:2,3-bisphosphoglycerate-independent phosphoglycerate mutase